MKKYILYTIIFGLLFSACNPNKDIYENIKDNADDYHTEFGITLTNDNYETISELALDDAVTDEEIANAESIAENLCFSLQAPANLYAGAFLDEEYIAPDSTSIVQVKYNYSVNEFDSIAAFTLSEEDYTAIGGVVADSSAFTYNELPGSYLPAYLASIDTTTGYVYYVTCDYWENDTTLTDTGLVYTYIDGSWQTPDNFYILTDADYESMGSPGNYHNFSDSDPPEHYLPIFLSNKFAYANEEDVYFIIYKYYSSGTHIRMDGYYFNNENWVNKIQKTDQFIQNGTEWVFDPTVHYSMVKNDYAILVEYIANHTIYNGYLDQTYLNTEYYYGASSYYDNFDMRIYKRQDNDPLGLLEGMSDDEIKTELTGRLKEGIGIFLELRFPDAEPVSNGVQVYYEVYYATYEPGDYFYKMRFKCTDVGTFEYIEGPTSLN
ncbi:MAG: hypothetical protein K8R54_15150 [Bacteroidales bacterium]|nr:hypothetical protein [Bacteroidales bacterium]